MKTAAPRWVCLQLLQACNLRCSMCYEWGDRGVHRLAVRPSVLEFEVVERIIGELAPHRPHYDLFGGEPLMYPRIAEVLRRIKENGSTVDIATNGTQLSDLAPMLVETGVDRLWVSIDGPEAANDRQRGAGTFASVTRGIAELARARSSLARPRVGITFVVTPLNHELIEETFLHAIDRAAVDAISIEYQSYLTSDQLVAYERLLRERFATDRVRFAAGLVRDPKDFASVDRAGVARQIAHVRAVYEGEGKHVATKPRVATAENTAAHFDGRFEDMTDRNARCVFPWLYAEVASNGDVTSCHTFYDLTFGNVNEAPLLEIWRSDRFEDARRYLRKNLFPVCNACCLYNTNPS